MIKNLLCNNVIYVLSEIQNETSLTFEHFRRSHQTSELLVRGSHNHLLKGGLKNG